MGNSILQYNILYYMYTKMPYDIPHYNVLPLYCYLVGKLKHVGWNQFDHNISIKCCMDVLYLVIHTWTNILTISNNVVYETNTCLHTVHVLKILYCSQKQECYLSWVVHCQPLANNLNVSLSCVILSHTWNRSLWWWAGCLQQCLLCVEKPQKSPESAEICR